MLWPAFSHHFFLPFLHLLGGGVPPAKQPFSSHRPPSPLPSTRFITHQPPFGRLYGDVFLGFRGGGGQNPSASATPSSESSEGLLGMYGKRSGGVWTPPHTEGVQTPCSTTLSPGGTPWGLHLFTYSRTFSRIPMHFCGLSFRCTLWESMICGNLTSGY